MADRNFGIIIVVEREYLAAGTERLAGPLGTRVTFPQQLWTKFARDDPALHAGVAKQIAQLRWGDSDKLEGVSDGT